MKKTGSIILTLIVLFSSPVFAQQKVRSYFDERVDLVAMVAMLSGAREYNLCIDKEYLQNAQEYFDAFKTSKAVKMFSEIRKEYHVSYDAVADYGLHLKYTGKKNKPFAFDNSIKEGSDSSFDRWPADQNKAFLKALNEFYVKSDFSSWYKSMAKTHEEYGSKEQEMYDMLELSWYGDFFEKKDKLSIAIINSLLLGQHNYGQSYELKDGTMVVSPTYGIGEWSDLTLVIHEFCHPYCNPLIDKYWDKMSDAVQPTFKANEKALSDLAYTNAKIMMYETLVRASVINYVMELLPDFFDDSIIQNEQDMGFGLIRPTVEALKEYRAIGKNTYPTLDSYMPVLVEQLKGYFLF